MTIEFLLLQEERRGEGRGEYLFQLHIDKANATPGFRNHPNTRYHGTSISTHVKYVKTMWTLIIYS
jgi:hypothetical protein